YSNLCDPGVFAYDAVGLPMKTLGRDVAASDRIDGSVAWARLFTVLSILVWANTLFIGFRGGLAVMTLVGATAAVGGLYYPVVGLYGIAVLCVLDPMIRVFMM